MQLSELRKDCRFLVNTSTSEYGDDDLDRAINKHYDQFVTFIWRNQAEWQFDDSNNDTLAVARTSLIADQRDYLLPTDAREVRRIEVRDANGNFRKVDLVHEADVHQSLDEYYKESGLPLQFALRGRSVILYPPPSEEATTLVQGLQIYVSRSVTHLSADGDEPGFDKEFHRVLSLKAAADWCISSENFNKKEYLEREAEKIMESAREFYANRDKTTPHRMRPKTEHYA